MKLPNGARLGPYEILAPLGAGGMGEVYKARDTRLDRSVAIKILSPEIAASPDARARFEREARTISQLSHPHICALYDVGEAANPESPIPNPYLVMELLDGETLADRLVTGALPLELTLRYATQMADALEKAHRQGIVHRDLKPSNVMITKAGVKLLDFGLAKAQLPASMSRDDTAMAVPPITAQGAIAGTVQYMAPEQLAGRQTDARSDIYALGAVIYEMAAGSPAFGQALKPIAPPALDRIVRGCMAPDPDERWQSAHDVRLQLSSLEPGEPQAAATMRSGSRSWLPWMVAAAAIIVGAALSTRGVNRAVPAAASNARFAIPPPEDGSFVSHVETVSIALSPDGSQLAFVASDRNGGPRIWLRKLSSLDATPIAGTDGSMLMSLFWSPDGRSLGFFAEGKLKRLDIQSGGIVTVCPVPEGIGLYGTWGSSGRILFASVEGAAIYQVPVGGGVPVELLRPDRTAGEGRLTWPWFLPDGERFLYTVRLVDGGARVMLAESGKAPRRILEAVSNVQYAEPGYLVFGNEGTLVAQRFDAGTGQVAGEPFAIAQPLRYFYSTATAVFTVSRTGTLVYQAHDNESSLSWYDRTGAEAGLVGPPGDFQGVRLSPDGNALLFDRARAGSFDLWQADLVRGVESVLTRDPGSEFGGVWHPDGRSVFFAADRKGPPHLFRKDLKTNADTEVLQGRRFQQPEDVSPDGRTLLFSERSAAGTFELWTVPVGGGATPSRLFNTTEVHSTGGRFSPDGRWVAYISIESGTSEVYVTPFPPTGERTRVSGNGATNPRWSRDGHELFYLSSTHQLVAVPVRLTPSLVLGAATTLFTAKGLSWRDYDVSVDGKRFIADVMRSSADQKPLTAVLNWPAEHNAGASR